MWPRRRRRSGGRELSTRTGEALLHDGVAPLGSGPVAQRPDLAPNLTVDLAGDAPVPVRGESSSTCSARRRHAARAAFAVRVPALDRRSEVHDCTHRRALGDPPGAGVRAAATDRGNVRPARDLSSMIATRHRRATWASGSGARSPNRGSCRKRWTGSTLPIPRSAGTSSDRPATPDAGRMAGDAGCGHDCARTHIRLKRVRSAGSSASRMTGQL